jgi:hypothetical protein
VKPSLRLWSGAIEVKRVMGARRFRRQMQIGALQIGSMKVH